MQQNPSEKPIKVETESPRSSSKRSKYDSRGRNVLATVAQVDGKICFVCAICDGDYVGIEHFQNHLAMHRLIPKYERPQSDIECIDLISSDEENTSNGPNAPQKEQSQSDKTAARTRGVSQSAKTATRSRDAENRRQSNDDQSQTADESPSKKRRIGTFNCKYCDEEFSTLVQLNCHRKDCDEWDKRFHACGLCPDKFPTQRAKRQHQLVEHREELPEKCGICRYTRLFATKEELNQHQIDQHATGVVYQCHFCDKLYSSTYEKNQHVKKDHPFGEYECEKCGKTLKSKELLDEHRQLVHKRTK